MSVRKHAVQVLAVATLLCLSACGWNWDQRESIFPRYYFDVEVESGRSNEFVSTIVNYSDKEGFPDPIVEEFSVFGTTDIYIENDNYIISVDNSVDLNVFRASFYCNYTACDLTELKGLALGFLGASSEGFKTSKLNCQSDGIVGGTGLEVSDPGD